MDSKEVLVKNNVFKEPEIKNFNLILHRDCYITDQKNIEKSMIDFAKLHVEAALEQAYNTSKLDSWGLSPSKEEMLNCYPKINIK